MDRYLIAQSVQNARITFGGGEGQGGHENGHTAWAISISNVNITSGKLSEGDNGELQIWLTVPQLAEIVKRFFAPIAKGFFYKILNRLLVKRWAIMTLPLAKNNNWEYSVKSSFPLPCYKIQKPKGGIL